MKEYLPIYIVGAIIGCVSLIFLIAFAAVKNKKEDMGFDRNMPDGEIIVRLLRYAKPHWKQFLLALIIMLFSIAYDVISPLIIGHIEETIKECFEMSYLLILVAIYGSLLVVSMACTYAQAMILQKTGQKILSELREDIFTHIQSLSHEQLNGIPVGKLVTRVCNDTNAISMMFTNILVNLVKNVMVILGDTDALTAVQKL